jgi:tRNA pseudouridine55 synthase
MKSLIRRAVGGFTIEAALKLSEIEELVHQGKLEDYIMPADQVFDRYAKLTVGREFSKLIYNGNSFYREHLADLNEVQAPKEEWFRVYDSEGIFIGIYRYDKAEDCYKPVKMFL